MSTEQKRQRNDIKKRAKALTDRLRGRVWYRLALGTGMYKDLEEIGKASIESIIMNIELNTDV